MEAEEISPLKLLNLRFVCSRCTKCIGHFKEVRLPCYVEMTQFLLRSYLVEHFSHENPDPCVAMSSQGTTLEELKKAMDRDMATSRVLIRHDEQDGDASVLTVGQDSTKLERKSVFLSKYMAEVVLNLPAIIETWVTWAVSKSPINGEHRFEQVSGQVGSTLGGTAVPNLTKRK